MENAQFSSQIATEQLNKAKLLQQTQREVRALAARDREVRAHEQAHAAAGGPYASHPHYNYTQGPNGVRYATSGHVNIDVGEVPGDAEATLTKMQTVVRAALAPAEPSAQDRAVAAKASAMAAQARAELAQEKREMDKMIVSNKTSPVREVGSTSGSLLDVIV
ncbi:MAG: putative metalloprotease CJM1_0395 family protein [Pseudomonadota bacterium]